MNSVVHSAAVRRADILKGSIAKGMPILRIALGLVLWAVAGTGCRQEFPQQVQTSSARQSATTTDTYVENAMGFLNHQEQYTPDMMQERILLKINQWIETQKPDVSWIADPLYSRLPSRLSAAQGDESLRQLVFQPFDVLILREAVWMRDVASSVARRDRPLSEYEGWLEQLSDSAGRDAAAQVRLALQLFDWTVRHIQQDEVRPATVAPESYLPTAGGKYYAWESMLLGHGDWLEQSRVFILLARQMHIPVVLLAIEESDAATPTPWCPAAWIGGEFYLFDMRLGLPVPGANDTGIATLRQVLDAPELLRQLDLDTDHAYPIRARHLQQLSVLLDATPAALSQRMRILERHLTGSDSMVLSATPTVVWQTMREHPGLARQSILTTPYEVYDFRRRLGQGLEANNEQALQLVAEFTREHRPFDDLTELFQGVILMFRGEFEDGTDSRGAKSHFGDSRHPDALINNLGTSEQAQKDTRLYQLLFQRKIDPTTGQIVINPETGEAVLERAGNYEQVVAAVQTMMRQVKQHASYLVGLTELDAERYESAEFWLKKMTRDAFPDSFWRPQTTYNLARVYEEQGRARGDAALRQQAAEEYDALRDAPIGYGSQIRARRLRK